MELKQKKKSQIEKIIDICTPEQLICAAFSLLLWLYFPVVFSNCFEFTKLRKMERPDYNIQGIEDCYMIPIYALIILILKKLVIASTHSFFHNRLKSKYDGDELDRKVAKWCRGAFKIIYFTCMFVFGWKAVLAKTHFAPPMMLCDGNIHYIFSDWPFTEIPTYLRAYYMISLSYYIEDLLEHLFESPNSDYFEMILHHLVTMLLIFSSYFNSFWMFGCLVLMQMDLADVFIGLIRVCMDFVNKYVTFVIYLGIMVSFIHFRIYAYTYWSLFSYGLRVRVGIDGYPNMVTVICIFLITLLLLNLYWLVLLFKMGLRFIFKGKAHDLQNVVTKKDITIESTTVS